MTESVTELHQKAVQNYTDSYGSLPKLVHYSWEVYLDLCEEEGVTPFSPTTDQETINAHATHLLGDDVEIRISPPITQTPAMTTDIHVNTRADVLLTAEKLINGDRNTTYGDPKDDFARTAAFWQTHLQANITKNGGTLDLQPSDVAIMMILLKISRLSESPDKKDNWVDLCGYGGCGADCAEAEYGSLK